MRTLIVVVCLFFGLASTANAAEDRPRRVIGGGGGGGVYVVVGRPGASTPPRRPDEGSRPTVTCVVTHVGRGRPFQMGARSYIAAGETCSDGRERFVYMCVAGCDGDANNGDFAAPLPDAAVDLLRPPFPVLRSSPRLEDVRSGNLGGYVVGMPIYFAVEPESWTPVTAVATAGPDSDPVWVRVVATPVGFEVDVDGVTVSCDGPGEVVDGQNWSTTTSMCRHVFESRGPRQAQLRILYDHVYSSNDPQIALPVGETGVGPTATIEMPVVEVQAVLRNVEGPPPVTTTTRPDLLSR